MNPQNSNPMARLLGQTIARQAPQAPQAPQAAVGSPQMAPPPLDTQAPGLEAWYAQQDARRNPQKLPQNMVGLMQALMQKRSAENIEPQPEQKFTSPVVQKMVEALRRKQQ